MSEAEIVVDKFKRPLRCGKPAPASTAVLSAAALLALPAIGGCASEPKPTAQMVRASTLVSEAEKGEAQHFAAADLQRAHLGEAYPVASNDTAAGRQQNRRVDIVFSNATGQFSEAALSRQGAIRR